jgi:O-acetyl-ADP-ribose deacetylase (regulator of RNase III)
MTQLTCYLRDLDTKLVAAWEYYFKDIPEVQPSAGDIFGVEADAIVSPANSFGYMDGGIDRVYSKHLGWHLQERLQELLRREYDGELPVGMAVIIETDHPKIPYLISAPTMHIPANVSNTLNAYLAFRAALRAVQKKNEAQSGAIKSIICPGMATATGEMPPEICAKQMYAAYVQVVKGQHWYPKSINEAILEYYRLLRVED